MYGLYQWLSSQQDYVLNCGIQIEIMVAVKLYYDPLVVFKDGKSRLSCQIGAQEFQHYVDRSKMLTVECMFGLDHQVN